MGGNFSTRRKGLVNFKLPEFSLSREIEWSCHIDERTDPSESPYDMIIGLDLIDELGLVIDFKDKVINWEELQMPMRPKGMVTDVATTHTLYHMAVDPPVVKAAEDRYNKILDANYEALDIPKLVSELKHLTRQQQNCLTKTITKYPSLTAGGLGNLNIEPIRLELAKNAKPYHAKPYGIPKAYENTTKKECKRFEDIGVWERVREADWVAGTFIQPKKTGDVRVLTDFRELNKYLIRRPHPLPKISDILQKLEGFRYATALDLSMGYYHIPLDKASQRLCGTVLPWGIYTYKKLPMGIASAPDIFQGIMSKLLGDLEYVQVYIDDILITSNGSFDDHMEKLDEVLRRLANAGFRLNVRKSFFAINEVDYLGYRLTRRGLFPQPKKVEAIQKLTPPTTKRQLRRLLGMVKITAICGSEDHIY